jgi:hypothetical protein
MQDDLSRGTSGLADPVCFGGIGEGQDLGDFGTEHTSGREVRDRLHVGVVRLGQGEARPHADRGSRFAQLVVHLGDERDEHSAGRIVRRERRG